MNGNDLSNLGAFGLITYLVVWFTKIAYPQTVQAVGAALATGIERTLSKIDAIEERCTEERRALKEYFRLEMEEARRLYREDLIAQRMARDADRTTGKDMMDRFERILRDALRGAHDIDPRQVGG